MDRINKALILLEELHDEILTDTYPASRNYIADHISDVIDILEEVSDAV